MNGPEEYIEADPGGKKDAWIFFVLGAIVVVLVLWMTRSQMTALRSVPLDERSASHLAGLQIIFWVAATALCAMAVHIFTLAKQVSRAGRFPPPGMKVLRRTRLLKGKDAERKSTMLYINSAFTLASAAALPLLFEWLRRVLIPQ
ncbi:MAG: hypothetical protein V3S11_00850 [Elusimicrobiota bacterium]